VRFLVSEVPLNSFSLLTVFKCEEKERVPEEREKVPEGREKKCRRRERECRRGVDITLHGKGDSNSHGARPV
jgi:hypothetical protein